MISTSFLSSASGSPPAALAKNASDKSEFKAVVGPVASVFSLRWIREVIEVRLLPRCGYGPRKVIGTLSGVVRGEVHMRAGDLGIRVRGIYLEKIFSMAKKSLCLQRLFLCC